jgi:hypothetical protein
MRKTGSSYTTPTTRRRHQSKSLSVRIEQVSYRFLASVLAVLLGIGLIPAVAFSGAFADSAKNTGGGPFQL